METIIEKINQLSKNTLVSNLGIEFIAFGDDYISAKMPVDERTIQPFGILHGGASVVLAETLGSVGSNFFINTKTERAVGLEINANHIRPVSKGWVIGKAVIVHKGSKTHVWSIEIKDEEQKLVCISRLTMSILSV